MTTFRGNPEDDQSMNSRKRGTKEGDQSEGNPKGVATTVSLDGAIT